MAIACVASSGVKRSASWKTCEATVRACEACERGRACSKGRRKLLLPPMTPRWYYVTKLYHLSTWVYFDLFLHQIFLFAGKHVRIEFSQYECDKLQTYLSPVQVSTVCVSSMMQAAKFTINDESLDSKDSTIVCPSPASADAYTMLNFPSTAVPSTEISQKDCRLKFHG